MNRFLLVLAAFGLLLAGTLVADAVHAQTALSEEQQQRIRANCVTIQTTLRQLLDNDLQLRRDRGALYDDISTKLMAPLSSRIALNKLDGLELGSITLQFDKQIVTFKASYVDYAKSMEQTVGMKCAEQPVEFYENVQSARGKRQRLHEENKTLVSLLELYKNEFNHFADRQKGDL